MRNGGTRTGLEAALWEVECDLMTVVRRLYVFEAFVEELERVTRGKPFRIWNDIAWMMVLDSRDMLVVHLGSFAKGRIYGKGALLPRIQAHHLRDLPAKRQGGSDRRRDGEFHERAFQRLFPSAKNPYPKPCDCEALIDKVASDLSSLLRDRHENRAHYFERGEKGAAKMLDVNEIRACVSMLESLLNDIRVVGGKPMVSYRDMNSTDAKLVACDLVDAVLLGHSSRMRVVMAGSERDAFYEALHARHSSAKLADDILFNDHYE